MNISRVIRISGLILLIVMCAVLTGCASTSNPTTQSTVIPASSITGLFNENERELLGPIFASSVTQYLRRYNPGEIIRNVDYVQMTAKYDYQLNIELFVRERDYEIKVSIAQDKFNEERAQRICARIAAGTNKTFTDSLINFAARGTSSDNPR